MKRDEENVILYKEDQEEYIPCISFIDNQIIICEETEDSINFIQELLDEPEDFKLYSIRYNNKEYQVIGEVLFALIVNEFKEIVEKDFILTDTEIYLPTENEKSMERIKVALDAIGLKGIKLQGNDNYDYSEQGEILNEILEKKELFKPYGRMIEEAIELSQSKRDILIETKEKVNTEETFQEEMVKKFSTSERTKMKLYRLDNYCLFIASRFFDTLDDHINFVFVSKRLRLNMEKFHYNPIDIGSKLMKFFPNVETQHIYDKKDKYVTKGRIIQYCDWRRLSYSEMLEIQKKNEGKKIEFKSVVWTETDYIVEYDKQNPNKNLFQKIEITIPEGIKELEKKCFEKYYLTKLTIPSTVTSIPKKYLENCNRLTNITLPLNDNQVILGNKIFKNSQHLEQDIYLPNLIKVINGKEVEPMTSFEIPTTVTSLGENCFDNCYELKQLTIPSQYKLHGNRLFYEIDKCLYSIKLPSSIKKLNEKDVYLETLKTFTIPENITKIGNYCFSDSEDLKEINGLN